MANQLASLTTARVLIVDDDHDMSYALAETVSNAGKYKVEHAGTGVEAVTLLRASSYSAMFLDMGIPDVNGIGVLKALMTDDTLIRPGRVFVITGMRRGVVMDRAAHVLGADGVIYKPFGLNEIEAALSGSPTEPDQDGFLVQPAR